MLEKFELIRPTSTKALFDALAQYQDNQVLMMAGGTDLIPELRNRKKSADYIIDLGGLGLDYIKLERREIKIGATTTFRSLAKSDLVQKHIGVLVKAAKGLGAVQTQAIATIGGNLCSAYPSADSATPLIVLDAKLKLVSSNASRVVNAIDFFAGPGRNALSNGEILSEISIGLCDNRRVSFEKIGRRKGMSLAILNCSTSFCLDSSGLIQNARIALGAAAPTPIRMQQAEAFINGKKPSNALFKQAGEVVFENICPRCSIRGSSEYRCLLAKALVSKHLSETLQQF